MLELHLNQIRQCERDCDILETLETLPHGLPEIYGAILDRISRAGPRNRTLARQALAWLLYCRVSMQLHHVATVACIKPPDEFTTKQKFKDKHGILRIFPTLICVHPDTKVVELCHFSVTQYLKSRVMSDGETPNKHYLGPKEGNALLMKACFTYLRSAIFAKPFLSPLPLLERQKELKRKLADRVAFYMVFGWVNHAKELDEQEICLDVADFLSGDHLPSWSELWELTKLQDYSWWQETEEEIERHEWSQDLLFELSSSSPSRSSIRSGLYYASRLGFPCVVEALLKTEAPGEAGAAFASPLMAALSNGHMNVVKVLVSNGANLEVIDQDDNALHNAVERNSYEFAELLLRNHGNLTKLNKKGEAPIHIAIKGMSEGSLCDELFELLLQKPNVPDQEGKTALHLAVSRNVTHAIPALLRRGANINAVDHKGRSPLHELALTDCPETLELFLAGGANVGLEDALGYTALHQATRSGNMALIERMWGGKIATSIDSDREVRTL
jgi:Ankyrin repeats (3 copies)